GSTEIDELLEAGGGDVLHLRDLAHGRNLDELVEDGAIPLHRSEIAAFIVRTLVERSIDRALGKVRGERIAIFGITKLAFTTVQLRCSDARVQIVDGRLKVADSSVDTLDFLVEYDIGLGLQLLVIGLLEVLE